MRTLIIAAMLATASPVFADQVVVPQVVVEETAGESTRPYVVPGIVAFLLVVLLAGRNL